MHHDQIVFGQFCAGIQTSDPLIIPFRDPSQENAGQGWTIEPEFRSAPKVVSNHDSPRHRRDVQYFSWRGAKLLIGHRTIGGAKVNGLSDNLLLAAAGPDALIVESRAGIDFGIFIKPLGVKWVRKSCPSPIDEQLPCRRQGYEAHQNGNNPPPDSHGDSQVSSHACSSLLVPCW